MHGKLITYIIKLDKVLILLVFFAFFVSCSNLSTTKNLEEGEIVYDVTYPNAGKGAMIEVYPKELIVRFKKNKVYNDFSSSMGMVSIGTISDPEKKCMYQTFKMLADKTASIYKENHIDSVLKNTTLFNVENTLEKKVIAGLDCKKVKLSSSSKELGNFDVYYTNEIKIKNYNWWTPFKKIDGVLMDYEVERYGVRMHLVAREVRNISITDDNFILSSEYKIIPITEMELLMKSLM